MMRCSRSVFEPQMRPLCSDFEDAGVPGAMRRLHQQLEDCVGPLDMPDWIWSLDFAQAVSLCARSDAIALLRDLCDRSQQFGAFEKYPEKGCPEQLTATVRLAYGAMLEAFAAQTAESLLPTDEVARVDQKQLATLYSDAYCVAVWTSAHAEYLATVNDMWTSATPAGASVHDLMVRTLVLLYFVGTLRRYPN